MDNASLIESQRSFFASGKTLPRAFRMEQLKKLHDLCVQYESALLEALQKDLHKSFFPAWAIEIGVIQSELRFAMRKLRSWMDPKPLPYALLHFYSRSRIHYTPYGNTLIIGAWNYPFLLALRPVIGAIAAGNTAIIKPSELAVNTARVLEDMINTHFDPGFLHVVNTDGPGTSRLLEEKFDMIFYTGGSAVGKLVYAAAAKHLTPVVLELGGKNPCIVAPDTNIDIAAKRIAWGKFSNAGQTCVATDYILVHHSIMEKLLAKLIENIRQSYGDDPLSSVDYGRIIDEKHFNRLFALLENTQIIHGGITNAQERYISPTIVALNDLAHPIMQEEIFGPVLPVIPYTHLEEALQIIAKNPEPLVLYAFTRNKGMIKRLINEVPCGDVVINEQVLHFGHLYFPIGGKGNSGMGKYQGHYSFLAFSHPKSVLHRSYFPDLSVRYPPYSRKKNRRIRQIFRYFFD